MSTLLRRQLEASLAHENAKIEIGFRQVQDPYAPDELSTVAVNIRSDIIEFLHHRGKIDHAQFTAGRYFLSMVEKAEGSAAQVVNWAREPVDSSITSTTIPDHRLDAATELIRVARYLGRRDYRLARRYLARDLEAYPQPTSQRERDYHYRRLRDILEDLAAFWGFAQDRNNG